MAQQSTSTAPKRGAASHERRPGQSGGGRADPKGDSVGKNVARRQGARHEERARPVNAVLLTRKHLEEVVEDAVKRGRMTRDDAQQMVQTLLQRGARQTDDFLSDLERLLGRGRTLERASSQPTGKKRRREPRRASSNLPIADYDELSAAEVQDQLDGLTPRSCASCATTSAGTRTARRCSTAIERKLR